MWLALLLLRNLIAGRLRNCFTPHVCSSRRALAHGPSDPSVIESSWVFYFDLRYSYHDPSISEPPKYRLTRSWFFSVRNL